MASPVNVGDAILLAQLAYRTLKSFKDAPVEFVEVQRLVDSVNEALRLLKDTVEEQPTPNATTPQDALERIVKGCESALNSLVSLLSKYTELDPGSTATSETDKHNALKSWKRIKWTKEGSDLNKLKATLTAHLSSLHLAVAARNGFKLGQIYRWFVNNLEGKIPVVPGESFVKDGRRDNRSSFINEPKHAIFSVSKQHRGDGSLRRTKICPQATFSDAAMGDDFASSQVTAFRCSCQHPSDSCAELPLLMLLNTAFPAKVITNARTQEWQVYVLSRSVNTPFVVILADVEPASMTLFLHHVLLMSRAIAVRNVNASAISNIGVSSDNTAVLFAGAVCPDISALAEHLLGVRVTANASTFDMPSVTYLQLIQTYSIPYSETPQDVTVPPSTSYSFEDKAELILCDKHGTRYMFTIHRDALIRPGSGSRFAQIENIPCRELTNEPDQTGQAVQCESVILEFRHSSAVPLFVDSIKSMQQELLKQYLQTSKPEEAVSWYGQSGDRSVQGCYLRNPSVRVLQHRSSQQYRLILMNEDQRSSVTVTLPLRVRDHLLSNTEDIGETSQTIEERLPAWFVRCGPEGTSIFEQSVMLRELLLPV